MVDSMRSAEHDPSRAFLRYDHSTDNGRRLSSRQGIVQGPLREWTDVLLDERSLQRQRLLDPVDRAQIRRKWIEHQSGDHKWQRPL